MVGQFFSADYAGRSDFFEGLSIWNRTVFQNIQGTWPVWFLSFADIEETSFSAAREKAETDEQIVFSQLDEDERAIWSLLLASGYLKARHCQTDETPQSE